MRIGQAEHGRALVVEKRCQEGESNPHGRKGPRDFECRLRLSKFNKCEQLGVQEAAIGPPRSPYWGDRSLCLTGSTPIGVKVRHPQAILPVVASMRDQWESS